MLKAEYQQRGPVPQDVIQAIEFEAPELQADEVLLELQASPINPSDVLTLTGLYGILPPLPAIGGNEGVARVVSLGSNVTGLVEGQSVLLPVGLGTWSTHIVAPAKKLIPLPEGADPQQLSMLSINPPTAALMLSEFADLKPGDWVIQNAANSAVGNYLIQLAKLKGLRTINIVRRESLIQPLQDIGADLVLVDGDDLPKRVRKATDKADIKLAIDAVGGAASNRLADCLATQGTLVNYGMMSGEAAQVSSANLIFKDITVKGFWLALWFQHASNEAQQKLYNELAMLIATGKLSAPIDKVFKVADIKEAVAYAAQGERNGKVLVTA
ncbi:zinc-dependent alcohol dehydrogenase family protein [Planctobacterium marinum]|uniref:zinc-dependent alcohol dehydrogenase family protein n=1 Tax=Planctobacterium marinum TaxID=1631968 RepID=UPI001E29A492|nr:zinc-dependent alcohol dehydrogenase family protein [Planctobacterium marinum]MCC2606396.1 zinc-dependent alcohol dehydrogenase family protein [Planctobacterium marinum]